jgi:phospholipase/carboxylesterase
MLRALDRPAAAGSPSGALVLVHGRGADEHDLFPLLDALDPNRHLLGLTPRGPLSLPPGGAHWYRLGGIPTPEPATFMHSVDLLSRWIDDLPFPSDRIVLGGFSQGAVMSLAVGLGTGRRRPAGIVALSGFVPEVPGFSLDLGGLTDYPVVIAHGGLDPVIPITFGREARDLLVEAGADVVWRESALPHTIDPELVPELARFVRRCLGDVAVA